MFWQGVCQLVKRHYDSMLARSPENNGTLGGRPVCVSRNDFILEQRAVFQYPENGVDRFSASVFNGPEGHFAQEDCYAVAIPGRITVLCRMLDLSPFSRFSLHSDYMCRTEGEGVERVPKIAYRIFSTADMTEAIAKICQGIDAAPIEK